MGATLIDGKAISQRLLQSVHTRVLERKQEGKREPCLAVIQVGDDPASILYVRNKKRACKKVGIRSLSFERPNNFSEQEILKLIDELNANSEVDGILVQLPLPAAIRSDKVIERITPEKDVDGFHPYNVGRLAVGRPALSSCTPKGIMILLKTYGIPLKGKNVTVIGQSNIVGKPTCLELLMQEATISICNRETRFLSDYTKKADIIIAAAGSPGLIGADAVQEGVVVIDVGINRLPDGQIVGDVDFCQVKEKASYITPVPGGVGPMTIASLMDNTLIAAQALS